MARQRDLEALLADLSSFLLLLDRESLSAAARAKKRSVAELLRRLQGPAAAEDAEYMMMRCLSPPSGVRRCRDGAAPPGAAAMDARGGRACEHLQGGTQSSRVGSKARGSSPPPPAEGSYEETKALGCAGHGGSDTDSSHYESYGEDDDAVTDRAHYLPRPPARPPPADPPGRPQAQLCGFLWRKRWLGRWAKQLFVVRERTLLGFRCAADLQPVLRLDLRGCRVSYKEKRGRRLQHALKVVGTAGEALLIGFPSRQQAEDWRKVIEEVSSNSCSPPASPCRALSRTSNPKEEEEDGARRIPSRSPGGDPKGGLPAVRPRWQRLWCAARRGALRMFAESGGSSRPPPCAVLQDGSHIAASGSPQRLYVARRVREFTVLQTRSDEEREAWMKSLRAKGGGRPPGANPSAETPGPGDGGRSTAAGALLLRRVPTPNAYMDEPLGQPPASAAPRRLDSDEERLLCRQRSSPTSAAPSSSPASLHGAAAAVPPARQQDAGSPQLRSRDFFRSQRTLTLPQRKGSGDGLDLLAGKRAAASGLEKGRLKAGSELTLLPHGESPTAGGEGSVLSPLLRRAASARSAWKRPASTGGTERGKVLQKRKEWEMKAAM